jgi:hypothetical protein
VYKKCCVTLISKMLNDCLIKFVILVILGFVLVFMGATMKNKGAGGISIGVSVCLFIWAYYVFTDPKCKTLCNSYLWSSKPVVVPTNFSADQEDVTLCSAQKWAQENSVEGFIACLKDDSKETYDVMYFNTNSYSGMETACTDCQIFYTDKFKVTLSAYSPADKEKVAGCPMNPYPYCNAEDIQNVYVNLGCGASKSLVEKLIDEGKIEDINDPKIVKCCETPDVCRARGIKAFPTVTCKNDVVIQGFCP